MTDFQTPGAGPLEHWRVGVRAWLETGEESLIGPGRLELLEAVERCRSISAAARNVGMSYRRAWLLIDGMNRAAGTELVITQTGGRRGGGANLTEQGRYLVALFRGLLDRVRRFAEGSLLSSVASDTGVVHVACATSLEDVLRQLVVDFSALEPAVRVRSISGASDELAAHLLAGAPADLFLAAGPEHLARLAQAGLMVPDSEVTLARNTLAAVGTTHGPPLRSVTDLAGPTVRRIAVADPGCPLGAYTRAYLEPLGLWDAVRARAVFLDNPGVVLTAVRSGRAEAGLVYLSDATAADGCRLLFRARPATVRCAAALTRRGAEKPAARSLLAFLGSRAARERFRRCGFLAARGAG